MKPTSSSVMEAIEEKIRREMADEEATSNLSTTVERLGGAEAAAYLTTNIHVNRNLRPRYVAELVADMLAGRWQFSGDPIRFDATGALIDGQHRLTALVQATKKQPDLVLPFVVMRGIDPAAIHVIDTGRARRPMDALKISGYANTALLASAARILLQLKQGPLTARRGSWNFSHSALLDVVERHPLLQESTNKVKTIRGIRPSALVAFHYMGSVLLKKPSSADAFLNVFNTGVPSYLGDPAHALREKLLHDRKDRLRVLDSVMVMSLAHVWNHFVKGNSIRQLKVPHQVEIDGLDRDKI